MRRRRQNYINRKEFHEAVMESKSLGEPTVRVCNLLRLLIDRFLSGPRYCRYDPHTKEDLASAALIKCLKNIKNYNPARGSPFSYYSLCCACACKDLLKKQYKQANIQRELRDEMRSKIPPLG